MDIRNCPECGEITIDAGLAFWPEIDEPVSIVQCVTDGCGWTGADDERVTVVALSAAAA